MPVVVLSHDRRCTMQVPSAAIRPGAFSLEVVATGFLRFFSPGSDHQGYWLRNRPPDHQDRCFR